MVATLQVAVVVMGVLIVVGVAVVAVTAVRRMSGPARGGLAASVLDEPAGTAVVGVVVAGDRVVLQLRGGGPDRVVVLDLRGGPPARIGLAR